MEALQYWFLKIRLQKEIAAYLKAADKHVSCEHKAVCFTSCIVAKNIV